MTAPALRLQDAPQSQLVEIANRVLKDQAPVFRLARAFAQCRDQFAGPLKQILPRHRVGRRGPAGWVLAGVHV